LVSVEADVRERIFLGDAIRIHATLPDGDEIIVQPGNASAAEAVALGDHLILNWRPDRSRLLDA
jgi:hypothetical protein